MFQLCSVPDVATSNFSENNYCRPEDKKKSVKSNIEVLQKASWSATYNYHDFFIVRSEFELALPRFCGLPFSAGALVTQEERGYLPVVLIRRFV